MSIQMDTSDHSDDSSSEYSDETYIKRYTTNNVVKKSVCDICNIKEPLFFEEVSGLQVCDYCYSDPRYNIHFEEFDGFVPEIQ